MTFDEFKELVLDPKFTKEPAVFECFFRTK